MDYETGDDPENVRGRPFPKGQSGNPNGRPKGSRNRMTLKLEELAYDNAGDIIEKVSAQARAGDQFAQRLYFDRILPRNSERPIRIEIPQLRSITDAPDVTRAIFEAAATGEITLGEAGQLNRLVESRLAALEARDVVQRIRLIEKWLETQ